MASVDPIRTEHQITYTTGSDGFGGDTEPSADDKYSFAQYVEYRVTKLYPGHCVDAEVQSGSGSSRVTSDDDTLDCEGLCSLIATEIWSDWCGGERAPSQDPDDGSAETIHPLRAAVTQAAATYQLAQDAFTALEESASLAGEDSYLELEAFAEAVQKAEEALDAAKSALDNSDCPREWALREEGHEYDTVTASSPEEALAIAVDNCDRANYSESEGTLYIDVRVNCEETGESASETVTLDAPEPDCADGETHDWQSPHALVGGLTENPGVHGHGGGVVITEVCRHCGCKRVTDTWAQNPTTGEQGLESVEYEEDAFTAEELAGAFPEE